MDFQNVCDAMTAMTCVVSVEVPEDGSGATYRIVTGNKAYISSIENPAPGAEMLTDKFTPNMEYTTYLTRDLNFEEYCYGAAVKKKCLHSYAHPDRLPLWFNMSFIPLDGDEGNLHYCLYMMEINFKADTRNMSNISGDLAASVLGTCLKLRDTDDFKSAIKEVLKDVRDLCDAEHCCILLMDTVNRKCSVLGEAFSNKTLLLPMETFLDDEFYKIAESWESTVIAGSNCLIAKDEHDMEVVRERNPEWAESITSAGGKNIVLFPLRSQGRLMGYMWAINFNADDSIKIKEALELTTFIVGSEIGSSLLIDRLKILSSRDMLTGVMNRNEMNNFVAGLSGQQDAGEGVAVIFADLNGLKAVNDEEGHEAGDILLKNASAALLEVFDLENVYRAGGDEFAVIIKGMSEKDMNEHMLKLKEVSAKYDKVSFSVGGCVQEDCRRVTLALRTADERMYHDKKEYYELHPEKMRATSKDKFRM